MLVFEEETGGGSTRGVQCTQLGTYHVGASPAKGHGWLPQKYPLAESGPNHLLQSTSSWGEYLTYVRAYLHCPQLTVRWDVRE